MDEQLKKQVLMAVVGFNLFVIVYQFGFNNTTAFSLVSWLIAIGVGVVGGIIGFVIGKFVG